MKLTKHFCERWKERVKRPLPTANEIEELRDEALFLQRGRDLFTPRGRSIRVLALYWAVEENLILKIDEKTDVAVPVLPPDMPDEEVG